MGEMFERAKSRVLDRIETRRDLLEFKLGAALKMERTVVEMLGELEEEARSEPVKGQLRHHARETRGQIENLKQAFRSLGCDGAEKPCPTIEAIQKEGNANVKIASGWLVDAVILCGAAETEHHEIAVYDALIELADGEGQGEVVGRLRDNLEQEQHALAEVTDALKQFAHQHAQSSAH